MNGWAENELLAKAQRVELRSILEGEIARQGHEVAIKQGAYDAGFEAGVLATEAGLGRYND